LTPEHLRIIGESVLSPDRWQSPLARILGMNLRTLQRYASGESPIPPEVAARLYMMVELAEIAAEKIGNSANLEFVVAGDGLVYPSVTKPFHWMKIVRVYGVPDHLDPIELRALARLLRRPRDWTRGRFQWSEL
jgi:hypothetical protein